jgi:diguanylate cyclase (GGDEF)-like protein
MSDSISEHVKQVLAQHIGKSETGLALIDANDRLLYCNPAFISMFGLEDYSPIGRTHDEFLARIFTHRMGNGRDKYGTLEAWMAQVHSHYRKQTYHTFEAGLNNGKWVLIAQQMYGNGEIVTVCTDITRSKEAELALRVAYAELERLAMTDELTGVPNRRHFLSQLESERQRALRYKHPVCLAMIDLDHFKQVNDRFGHPAGDEVLKHFSGLLRSQMRGEDVVGRLGGEEFALLMPETAPSGAQVVLERIRGELAKAPLDFIAPGFRYTFSAGVAGLALTDPAACNHWIHEADQALYRAKKSGRDRTVLYRADDFQ